MKDIMTVPRREGVIPHCETLLENRTCPYLAVGCEGCKMNRRVGYMERVDPIKGVHMELSADMKFWKYVDEMMNKVAESLSVPARLLRKRRDHDGQGNY